MLSFTMHLGFCAFDMLDVCCIALKGVAASEQLVKEYGLVCG